MSDSTPSTPPAGEQRRLAAIVFTDVVGYSARMQRDETGTMKLVAADFTLMRERCAQHGGELLNSMGDGLLLCFGSAVQAVACALQIQAEFAARRGKLPPEQALEHRMGVHIGDVFRPETGGIAGDGVNIAARLEGKAPIGGVCVSQMVYDTVKGKLPMQAVFAGPETFKNIAEPIPIWHLAAEGAPTLSRAPLSAAKPSKSPLLAVAVIAVVVIAVAMFFALRPMPKENPPAAAPVRPVTESKPAAPATSAVTEKSIAVLPFTNMSEDKDTGFFADGVHEDLLTNLAVVAELKVVSRTSVLQYRGTTKTMRQIGQELGVAYLLEGSVRRAGNKVRVTGQLINTRTDEHVWAKSYDRDLTDIFAIQSAIAQEIAGALSAAISPQTKKFLDRRPTENSVAYDFYLKGRDSRNRAPTSSAPALREAEELFKTAVQQDPAFAAAWGELAVVHALFAFWSIDGSPARLAAADAAIAQAVRLAPEAPDVIRLLGNYAYYAHRDYARATAQYEKLARLQPNDPTVFSSLSLILRRQGRWAESLNYIHRALELDPGNVAYIRNSLATLGYNRRWDESLAARRRLVALLPEKLREQFDLAAAEFTATGSLQAADDLLARLSPAERDSPVGIYNRKSWAVARGDYAEFKRLDQLKPIFEEAESPAFSALKAATVYWAHGDMAAVRNRLTPQLAELQGRVEREPASAVAWSFLGSVEVLLGQTEEGMRHHRKAMELVPETRDAVDGPTYRYGLALIYALTGDKDQAIAELTRLLRAPGDFSVATIRVDPGFAKLRGDPRFEALLNDPKNNQPLF